jgi:FlaA1/EpsC-like NDP-sugar epimerase
VAQLIEPSLVAALLGRPERELLTPTARRGFAEQRVLVTGAGGSIGSQLARRLADCRPAALTLVDNCELNLFQIEQELKETAPEVRVDARMLDITRATALHSTFHAVRPHVVYHAAAYKHVCMLERDVCTAVRTNVLGTAQVVEAARAVGSRFVLVSSDKASIPHSVMGATKRLAELVALAAASPRFRSLAVRFGNVLGSSGSLVAVMLDRIRRGLPVDLTNPEAERFFMSAHEAVSLVMVADQIGSAGEIYWLDMGRPVRIGDVVERLMMLTEAMGFPRVAIRRVGLRPGEKLREEMAVQGLELVRTRHRRIFVARQPELDRESLGRALRSLRHDVRRNDSLAVLAGLCNAVPEFKASEEARQSAARVTLEAATVRKPSVHARTA